MSSIVIEADDYALAINPEIGGSLSAFRWRGHDIMRSAVGDGVLDSSCFPLVPFSNRIAGSRFEFGGRTVQLTPNHPTAPQEPVLHGFGWTSHWDVVEKSDRHAIIGLEYREGPWPWQFRARAEYALDASGLRASLSIRNLADSPMPAGLGFHPYFPRTPQTVYRGLHHGEWQVDEACLPLGLKRHSQPRDWWGGQPVDTRIVDTVYAGREGHLDIIWPERKLVARISPSDELDCTVIYVPQGEDYFCVEPVSHATDAINRMPDQGGMRTLAPGEQWTVSMSIEVRGIS